MSQPTRSSRKNKPRKPRPDFPLYSHRNGSWAKKIRGQTHFFGPWADWKGAEQKYLDQRDDLNAGRKPRTAGDGQTIADLCNRFLTTKRRLLDARELTVRTFTDYYATCKRIVEAFGKNRLVDDLRTEDFEQLRAKMAKGKLGKGWSPATLANEIQRIRVLFKYASDAGLVEKIVRFGPGFKRPSKKTLRQARQAKGQRMFEAKEIHALLGAASVPLRAMILLGLNCGFGNNDCGTLPKSALDLKKGWLNFPRPKTAIARRVPIWPETIEALKQALSERPKPADTSDEKLVFITQRGQPWSKVATVPADSSALIRPKVDDPLAKEISKLLKTLGLKRPGLSFYAIRHTHETVAGESRDQVAVDAIMGHARDDMASVYRERISDERLQDVVNYVRGWLFPRPRLAEAPEEVG